MSDEVQRRIAELAFRRGYLEATDLTRILLHLGRRLANDESVSLDLWLEREWLAADQLRELLEDLPATAARGDEPIADGGRPRSSIAETAESDAAPDGHQDTGARSGANGEDEDFALSETNAYHRADAWNSQQPGTDTNLERLADEQVYQSDATSSPQADDREEVATRPRQELSKAPDDQSPTETLTDLPPDYFEKTPAGRNLSADEQGVTTDASGMDPSLADTSLLSDVSDDNRLDPADRFILEERIGRGGSGRVVRAYDRLLERRVAMKILRADPDANPTALARFLAEAQATGQLEHPNIVPIHDFGILPGNRVYYTMREVQGHSLRQVLNRVKEGEEDYQEEYTLVRLLNILRQVSQATHYAHDQSVIHRDLKPENIMLGDFGEVMVMDWGLAQVIESQKDFSELGAQSSSGQTLGTPSYMPPEQAKGQLERVDATSDIYSLGAILYEILTLEPPFSGDGPIDVMWAVVDSDLAPPSDIAPQRVPDELERICLKAMARRQDDRYASARAFHDDLEAWLEGRQPREAERLVEEGDEAAERYHTLLEEIEQHNLEVRRLAAQIDDWQGPEAKQPLWSVEDERDQAEAESARAFCKAVTRYTKALAYDPATTQANQGLADLYWTRLRRAEMRRDLLNTIYFKTLVERYDPGTYKDRLEGHSDLRVDTEPDGAELTLFDYEVQDRRLEPTNPRKLGESPAEVEALPLGSYLVKIDHDNCRKIEQPVFVERDRNTTLNLRLPDDSQFQHGFRFVPGSEYISGGDPEAFNPRPPERTHVDPFFCQTFPVTFEAYLEWFNLLYDRRGEQAMDRAPQTREAEGLLVDWDDQRDRWVPSELLIEGEARERYPPGEGYEYKLPVLGIRAEDAEAYARWKCKQDGRDYRLPTVQEYEKAGRGVDGRRFPWGNYFDATFCKMRFSRPENPPQPEPVGQFEDDISPYGIRDLAGGVQEWCLGGDDHDDYRPTKGGGWGQDERLCHLASTVGMFADARSGRLGFRLVYEPDFHD